MQLESRQKDGATLREHLRAVPFDRLSAEDRALLSERPQPPGVHVWPWFLEIAARRRVGFSGADPIGFDQVMDWQAVYRRQIKTWEIRALFAIDDAWRKLMQDKGE